MDVRCEHCGEEDALRGERDGTRLTMHCETCGGTSETDVARRCPSCGATGLVARPLALVDKARGTQLSVHGYSTVHLCRTCDGDVLRKSIASGSPVFPDELPVGERG